MHISSERGGEKHFPTCSSLSSLNQMKAFFEWHCFLKKHWSSGWNAACYSEVKRSLLWHLRWRSEMLRLLWKKWTAFFFLESGGEVKLSGEGENGAHYSTFRGMENACIDSVVLRKKHVHHRNMRRNMKDDLFRLQSETSIIAPKKSLVHHLEDFTKWWWKMLGHPSCRDNKQRQIEQWPSWPW